MNVRINLFGGMVLSYQKGGATQKNARNSESEGDTDYRENR